MDVTIRFLLNKQEEFYFLRYKSLWQVFWLYAFAGNGPAVGFYGYNEEGKAVDQKFNVLLRCRALLCLATIIMNCCVALYLMIVSHPMPVVLKWNPQQTYMGVMFDRSYTRVCRVTLYVWPRKCFKCVHFSYRLTCICKGFSVYMFKMIFKQLKLKTSWTEILLLFINWQDFFLVLHMFQTILAVCLFNVQSRNETEAKSCVKWISSLWVRSREKQWSALWLLSNAAGLIFLYVRKRPREKACFVCLGREYLHLFSILSC